MNQRSKGPQKITARRGVVPPKKTATAARKGRFRPAHVGASDGGSAAHQGAMRYLPGKVRK